MNSVIKLAFAAIFIVSAISSLGYVTIEFPGWAELTRISPHVVIVKCKSSPESTHVINGVMNPNPMTTGRMGGVTLSDIEIVCNLKGTNSEATSSLTLWSEYRPCQGDEYLLFATDMKGTNVYALDIYRIVPLGHSFDTNSLKSLNLKQQVKVMLEYRLRYLNRELKQGQEEKTRLEQASKIGE
jgi:hypothetical protein